MAFEVKKLAQAAWKAGESDHALQSLACVGGFGLTMIARNLADEPIGVSVVAAGAGVCTGAAGLLLDMCIPKKMKPVAAIVIGSLVVLGAYHRVRKLRRMRPFLVRRAIQSDNDFSFGPILED